MHKRPRPRQGLGLLNSLISNGVVFTWQQAQGHLSLKTSNQRESGAGEGQIMVRWSGEIQVRIKSSLKSILSLTWVAVKLFFVLLWAFNLLSSLVSSLMSWLTPGKFTNHQDRRTLR